MSDTKEVHTTKKNTIETGALDELFARLRAGEGAQVPQGRLRRSLRLVGTSLGAGLSALSGKVRGRGQGGLDSIDLKAIQRMVGNMGELKGIAMKAGQIMSYIDDTLPPETRELLALLQTQSQPSHFETVAATIRQALPARGVELVAGLEHEPHAVASIGQVHRAHLDDKGQLAVKVLHPGIREALEADFSTAKIGPLVARFTMPGGVESMKGFMAEMRDRMLEECDYTQEARWQERFGELFAGETRVIVPLVHPEYCAPSVLTTTWEEGLGFEDFLASDPPQKRRNAVGQILFDIYFGSLYRHGLFHADPHPGNYAMRADGAVVLYDFGCMRQFDKQTVQTLAQLAHAVAADDKDAIIDAFEGLGGSIPNSTADFEHARKLLRGFFRPLLTPGVRQIEAGVNLAMGEVVRDKRMIMRLKLPGKLFFLFRIRFGLYAILARLQARCDWAGLERALAEEAWQRQ